MRRKEEVREIKRLAFFGASISVKQGKAIFPEWGQGCDLLTLFVLGRLNYNWSGMECERRIIGLVR